MRDFADEVKLFHAKMMLRQAEMVTSKGSEVGCDWRTGGFASILGFVSDDRENI